MDHIPVLLNEVVNALDPKPGGFVIDGTVGNGGHAIELAKRIAPGGTLLGVDRDPQAIARAREKHYPNVKIFLEEGNYADLPELLVEKKLGKANGLLLDLGFSSFQIDDAKRGFSFQRDGPLDMRYGREGMTAAEVINVFPHQKLVEIFERYGEEKRAEKIVHAIVVARRKERIRTTGALAEVIESAVGPRRGHIHSATKVFQALRIYVNGELQNLETILDRLSQIMMKNGRVVIISFHSLEDRIVKNRFREFAKSGQAKPLTKKPIVSTHEEILQNPRSRSAKLRAIELI